MNTSSELCSCNQFFNFIPKLYLRLNEITFPCLLQPAGGDSVHLAVWLWLKVLEEKNTYRVEFAIHLSLLHHTLTNATKLAVGGIISWYQEPGSIINPMCPLQWILIDFCKNIKVLDLSKT